MNKMLIEMNNPRASEVEKYYLALGRNEATIDFYEYDREFRDKYMVGPIKEMNEPFYRELNTNQFYYFNKIQVVFIESVEVDFSIDDEWKAVKDDACDFIAGSEPTEALVDFIETWRYDYEVGNIVTNDKFIDITFKLLGVTK